MYILILVVNLAQYLHATGSDPGRLKIPVLRQAMELNDNRPLNQEGWLFLFLKQISHFYSLGNSPWPFFWDAITALTWECRVLIMIKTRSVHYIQLVKEIGEEPDCDEVLEAVKDLL